MNDEHLIYQFIKDQQSRYYGKYRGFVADTHDPEKIGRVRLSVPAVLGDQQSNWALPCFPYGGSKDQSWFAVPEVGAQVWVEFEGGDPDHPIWTGCFPQKKADLPKNAEPENQLLRTATGNELLFKNQRGKGEIHLSKQDGCKLSFNEKGEVSLQNKGGEISIGADGSSIIIKDKHRNTVSLKNGGVEVVDQSGNKITMKGSRLTVSGKTVEIKSSVVNLGGSGGEPLLKGKTFLEAFLTHTHPSPAGPTGPPVAPSAIQALSTRVKTL